MQSHLTIWLVTVSRTEPLYPMSHVFLADHEEFTEAQIRILVDVGSA